MADRIATKAPHLVDKLLSEATEEGDLIMIEQLLSRAAKLERAIGNQILLLAARNGSLSLVDTCLENGPRI